MRAARLHEIGGIPRVDEIPEPAGDELLEVLVAGLNPVDITIGNGRFHTGAPDVPYVIGTEVVATKGDGRRYWYYDRGTMAELIAPVLPGRVIPVPEGVPDDLAIACGVAGLTGWLAVTWRAPVGPDDTVLVLGPGPIGLLCAVMAKLSGARHLIVAGLPADAKRLAVAKQIGADSIVAGDPLPAIRELGDGLGVDVGIDAAGVSATLQTAMKAVRPGGQILKVGWGPQPLNFSLDPLVQKAVQLRGSFSHNWPVWERVIAMIAAGQINLDPVISRVAPLAEWHDCFEKMHSGEYVKAVLKPCA